VEDFSENMIVDAGITGVHSFDFGDIHRPSAKSRLSARTLCSAEATAMRSVAWKNL
jgi:hypothetical protein